MHRLIPLAFCLLAGLPLSAGESAPARTFRGTVLTHNGQPAADITVILYETRSRMFTLTPEDDREIATAKTNAKGEFFIKTNDRADNRNLLLKVPGPKRMEEIAPNSYRVHFDDGIKQMPSEQEPNRISLPAKWKRPGTTGANRSQP